MNKTILFLYSELMPYNLPWFSVLVKQYCAKVVVVHWDTQKLTPYVPPPIEGVVYYPRSTFNTAALLKLTDDVCPDLIYVSGRMDKGYLSVAKKWKAKNIPVVSGLDTPWQSTWKQWIASWTSRLFFKPYFSHLWIPGCYQYSYAQRLGYLPLNIIHHLYSANTQPFLAASEPLLSASTIKYAHRILFIGRLSPDKGVDLLTKAFIELKQTFLNDWKLTLVGEGPLRSNLPQHPDIEYFPFMHQIDLAALTQQASLFCLPSHRERWGVVVHEAAAAGLPLLLASNCGAGTAFLIDGHNGCFFEAGNFSDLKDKLVKIILLAPEELLVMRKNSRHLAQKISPETSVANLMFVLK